MREYLDIKGQMSDNAAIVDLQEFARDATRKRREDISQINELYKIFRKVNDSSKVIRVTTQFDATSATLANVTDLSHNVESGRTYRFRAVLFYDADATGGHKYAISGTATATAIIYNIDSIDNSGGAFVINSRETALGGDASEASATAGKTIIEGSIVVNAGGTLTVQFAQSTANGTSSILVGSTFEIIAEV